MALSVHPAPPAPAHTNKISSFRIPEGIQKTPRKNENIIFRIPRGTFLKPQQQQYIFLFTSITTTARITIAFIL